MPAIPTRVRWKDTLHSFAAPNYRWYAAGLLTSNIGGWISRIATDWLVLEITGDIALLGLVIAAQLLPPMLLGAWGGVVSSWIPPRIGVMVTQLLFAALFAFLGALVLLGSADKNWVLIISVLIGIVSCLDGPSRAMLTYQTVGASALPNAISLNAIMPQFAGVVGAALAGVLIATIGIGWALFVAGGAVIVGMVTTICIRTARLEPAIRLKPGRGQIREAVRYAAAKPNILLSIVMVGILSLSGLSASVLLAWMADTKFGIGASGYSMFSSIAAAGAMLGAILSAKRRRFSARDNAVMLAISGAIWLTCGLSPWIAAFLGGLLAAGIVRMLFLVANDTLTQLSSNTAIRARVVSLYLMVATGGQVIGSIVLGWMVAHFGGDVAFVVTGLVPLVAASGIWVALTVRARRRQLGRWMRPA